jgi:cell division protein FtsB
MAGSVSGWRRLATPPGWLSPANRARRRGRRFGPVNTRRAAILALVVCALALTIAAPLRTYLGQRAKIAEQQARQQQLTTQLHHLQHRKQLLSDPQYVRTQARKRLLYVEKVATPYIVAPRGHGAGASRGSAPAPRKQPRQHQHAWYERLWASLPGSGG